MTSQAFEKKAETFYNDLIEKAEEVNNPITIRFAIRLREICAARDAKLQEVIDEVNAAKAAHAKWLAGDRDED